MTTWRELITKEMDVRGDSWINVVSVALPDKPHQIYTGSSQWITPHLDAEFSNGYGSHEGCSFTVWTNHYVYFPAVYDGLEWVASVSRNPDGVPTEHVGGE